MRSILRCLGLALTGALGFGSMALAVRGLSTGPLPFASLLTLPLAGAVGGGCLAWLAKGLRAVPDAAVRFALGFVLSDLMAWFSLISLQARVEPSWGAIAWGIGLGLGGGIGGSSLWRAADPGFLGHVLPALFGALAFGFSGAVGGWVGFSLVRAKPAEGLDIGMNLALAMGGALLGAALGAGAPMPPGPARRKKAGLIFGEPEPPL